MRDFDRPLANRGLKASVQMGTFMQDTRIAPQMILCSTSHRTRATLGLILPFLRGDTTILLEHFLYKASDEDAVIERLQSVPGDIESVMVIGHNPVMQDLALTLIAPRKSSDAERKLAAKFPTAALASVELDRGGWAKLAPGKGALIRFVTPSDLD